MAGDLSFWDIIKLLWFDYMTYYVTFYVTYSRLVSEAILEIGTTFKKVKNLSKI